mmetsp:Transcript_29826/g.87020  ORF Transcript_29826/g.87020 Transcript_29826/m.87020 type:complete len:778 (-) Transcript_29826:105-2438(-)
MASSASSPPPLVATADVLGLAAATSQSPFGDADAAAAAAAASSPATVTTAGAIGAGGGHPRAATRAGNPNGTTANAATTYYSNSNDAPPPAVGSRDAAPAAAGTSGKSGGTFDGEDDTDGGADNDSAYEDVTDDGDGDDDDDDDENDAGADMALAAMGLFELISGRHFAAAIDRCASRPSEARRWDSVHVGGSKNDDATWSQCLPLHRACGLDPTPDLVAALLTAHSDAIAERESYWGRLPLHVACLSGASYDAVQPLLQRYPQGSSVVAIHDRLPLHYACGGNAPRRIVLALLKIYPRGARCLDAYGWLPLHWAATFHKSPAVISAIIEAYPEALHKETNKGKTPFQCARSSKQRGVVDKGIDIAADRGVDVNPPRIFSTAKVKDGDGPRLVGRRGSTSSSTAAGGGGGGMRRVESGGGSGMRRVTSSGSVGSLSTNFGDIFGSLGRRKSRSGLAGDGPSRSGPSANATWGDDGGTSSNAGGGGGGGYRRSSSRRDETLRRRRRSSSRGAIARALGNLMTEHESNASLSVDQAVLRGGHGSSSGSGSQSIIAAGGAALRSRGSRGGDDPPRRRRRSTSHDAISRVIGKLMNADQSLVDEDVIEKGETNALISDYANPGDASNEFGEERNGGSGKGKPIEELGCRRRSEPNLVVLNDVDFGDDDDSLDSNRRARRGRRRTQSVDPSRDMFASTEEQSVELTSRAAIDNCKEGAPSRGRGREPHHGGRERGQRARRSGSIDAINRVIKAVGVKSFEFVETDAADERPFMERKSSAKLE